MAHGGARPGAGRKKNGVNRVTEEALAAAEAGGEMPLAFLLRIMRDEGAEEAKRIDCAKAAAPYVHAKLNAIDLTGGDGAVANGVKGALAWKPQQ
jgi:hypothetical protein